MAKFSYQRASTNKDKQSLLRQEKFAIDHEVPKCNWYQEYASGAKTDRLKLQQLLSLLKEGDELYVIEASRLTRSLKQLLDILDFVKEKKIKLVMGDFSFDVTAKMSPFLQGQLMFLGMMNEINRLIIVSNVQEGVDAAREEGRIGGQPRLTKERLYEKNPDFFKYYAQYKNKQITLKELGLLSQVCKNTVYNYIKVIESR